MILCECGEIIEGDTFKDYLKTSASPSTPTVGHKKCGYIFNFIDGKLPRKYSSKIALKSFAVKFAEKNKMDRNEMEKFLIAVDRLKSGGHQSDIDILKTAFQTVKK